MEDDYSWMRGTCTHKIELDPYRPDCIYASKNDTFNDCHSDDWVPILLDVHNSTIYLKIKLSDMT